MQLTLTQFTPQNGLWTGAITAAVAALQKAGGGVLCLPAGVYATGPIELCPHMELHLEPGAVLQFTKSAPWPLRPLQYEGATTLRPAPCIAAYGAAGVSITGRGVVDGGGAPWWAAHRAGTQPQGRPYLLHFEDCTDLLLRDVTLKNSPAWTVHPLRCQNVRVEGLTVHNPYDALNTDDINPESCRNVRITGCLVDVGDDCITLKAGTEVTAAPPPCENILIADCCLVHGHGGIVIGSEMSGGVRNVCVNNCVFTGTDRGVRIKTRRRRGGTVENLTLSNLVMENVFCPFVCNMYYCCGTTEADRWVWEKTAAPVDSGTPAFRNIHISQVTVQGATACAGFFYGLAESPIENISLTDCRITLNAAAPPQKPAMMGELEPMSARGLYLRNVRGAVLRNVTVAGATGPLLDADASVALTGGAAAPAAHQTQGEDL